MKSAVEVSKAHLLQQLQPYDSLDQIEYEDDRRHLIWEFLTQLCSRWQRFHSYDIKRFYELVITMAANSELTHNLSEGKKFLCIVDREHSNGITFNRYLLNFLSEELQYENEPRIILLILGRLVKTLNWLSLEERSEIVAKKFYYLSDFEDHED